MSKGPLKILVVDDSAFMRLLITDILAGDDELVIIGTANDGKQAVDFVRNQKPDLILMDLVMEEYDGLYAIREIMTLQPVPILILSAVGNTNLGPVFEALRLGAVDYLNKPNRNSAKMRLKENELIYKIKQVAQKAQPKHHYPENDTMVLPVYRDNPIVSDYRIVVIGASTGGPTAIEQIVKNLPSNLPVPTVVVQHMPANFISSFIERLDGLSAQTVKMAAKGVMLEPGCTYIATGDANVILKENENEQNLTIDYDPTVYREYDRPSINALFYSAAKLKKGKVLAAILTGMGKDGVKGLVKLKEKDATVLVQDKETSVIFGMPKAAIESGVADYTLPLYKIASKITKLLNS
jgi:two-component system chemotaxis response regulator CheB